MAVGLVKSKGSFCINKPFARKKNRVNDNFQVSMFQPDTGEKGQNKEYRELTENIKNIDIENLTPMQSFKLLNDIIEKAKQI